jgi:hypothetical protein
MNEAEDASMTKADALNPPIEPADWRLPSRGLVAAVCLIVTEPIPDLFRHQANALGEFLKRAEIRTGIGSGGDFVAPALAGQQRPHAPPAPAHIGSAALSLSEAVMVVAAPVGAEGHVHLEHGVHDAN